MQLNLTWVDALAALSIGIFGSVIAAYIFANGRRWASSLATWWAERSQRTARARIEVLTRDLATIEAYRINPNLYFGMMARKLAVVISGFTLVVTCFVMFAFIYGQTTAARLLAKIDPPYTSIDLATATYVLIGILGMAAVVLFISMSITADIGKYSNLNRRKTELNEQIARLQKRVSR